VRYYRQAAAGGLPTAQYRLGLMYEAGRGGLERDPWAAKRCYALAARAGHADAARKLRPEGSDDEDKDDDEN